MSWFDRPAPVEASAAERAAPTTYFNPDQCAACGSRNTQRHTIRAGDYDLEVCVDPKPCRKRAEDAGIWKVYPR